MIIRAQERNQMAEKVKSRGKLKIKSNLHDYLKKIISAHAQRSFK